MKKRLKVVLSAVCFIAAGAFFMGCANPNGGETGSGSGSGSSSGAGTGSGTGSGGTGGSGTGTGGSSSYIGKKAPGTVLAVGDIVFNDGSATPYSVIDARTDKKCTDAEKAAAIAVIFRVGDGTEGNKTLGVGIKHERNGLAWCKNDAAGYGTKFIETVCEPDEGTSAGSLTFKNSPNTDGSKNLAKMIAELTKTNPDNNDTGVTCNADGTINFSASPNQTTLKTNYSAFEFAYYYGKNEGHNTKGTAYETGWYLPSLSELNDVYQVNKTGSIVDNALEKCSGANNKFGKSRYWSSSQSNYRAIPAYSFDFKTGSYFSDYKNGTSDFVCAVRAFN